ncbi:hypothetical protein [Alcanivorax sp.]|uniref:hypothetical protein n=1 Tax=Alcanivorax sp. TaxID=1872427 RepID=UPI0025B9B1D8|nr:hypothetical protein [Alcanivorax sp.]
MLISLLQIVLLPVTVGCFLNTRFARQLAQRRMSFGRFIGRRGGDRDYRGLNQGHIAEPASPSLCRGGWRSVQRWLRHRSPATPG